MTGPVEMLIVAAGTASIWAVIRSLWQLLKEYLSERLLYRRLLRNTRLRLDVDVGGTLKLLLKYQADAALSKADVEQLLEGLRHQLELLEATRGQIHLMATEEDTTTAPVKEGLATLADEGGIA